MLDRFVLESISRYRCDPGDPALRLGLVAEQRYPELRQVQQAGGEDDRDDAGLVHLHRDVGGRAAVHPAADHPLGVLHRDAPLGLLHEDHERDHHEDHDDREQRGERAPVLVDRQQLARDDRDDLGEDHDRHAVADAAVGDQLAHPHDDGGARHHRDHHRRDVEHGRVGDDRVGGDVAVREQRAAAGKLDVPGRLQDRQADGQVPGVLRDLRLAGLALVLERLKPGDDDGQQLEDDARGDVRHDAEREHRQVLERVTAQQVDDLQRARRDCSSTRRSRRTPRSSR